MIGFFIIGWVVTGFIALAVADSDEPGVMAMAFFWPISLPILLFFGFWYAVYSAFRAGIKLFTGDTVERFR